MLNVVMCAIRMGAQVAGHVQKKVDRHVLDVDFCVWYGFYEKVFIIISVMVFHRMCNATNKYSLSFVFFGVSAAPSPSPSTSCEQIHTKFATLSNLCAFIAQRVIRKRHAILICRAINQLYCSTLSVCVLHATYSLSC